VPGGDIEAYRSRSGIDIKRNRDAGGLPLIGSLCGELVYSLLTQSDRTGDAICLSVGD